MFVTGIILLLLAMFLGLVVLGLISIFDWEVKHWRLVKWFIAFIILITFVGAYLSAMSKIC